MKYLDVTRTIFAGMKKYHSDPDVEIQRVKSLARGNSCNLNRLVMGSHAGTHVDAPRHIYERGKSVEQLRPDNLVCRAFVLDLGSYTIESFFSKKRRRIIRGLVLKNLRRGLTSHEAEILLSNGIRLVGTSRTSIEGGADRSHPVHRLLLRQDVIIVESLSLRKARAGYCTIICLPLKIKNGDGAPARAFLIYD